MKKLILSLFVVSSFAVPALALPATTQSLTCATTAVQSPDAALFGLDSLQPFRFKITPAPTYNDPTAAGGWVKAEMNGLTSGMADQETDQFSFMVHLHPGDPRNAELIFRFNAIHSMADVFYVRGSGEPTQVRLAAVRCN
jgi:hypothetical protein